VKVSTWRFDNVRQTVIMSNETLFMCVTCTYFVVRSNRKK
jgi:hypothetical protein